MLSAYVLIETEVGKVAHVVQALHDLDGVQVAEDLAGPYDVTAKIRHATLEMQRPGNAHQKQELRRDRGLQHSQRPTGPPAQRPRFGSGQWPRARYRGPAEVHVLLGNLQVELVPCRRR